MSVLRTNRLRRFWVIHSTHPVIYHRIRRLEKKLAQLPARLA